MLDINKIYNGDCIELMSNIPDGSIDCILTDPPYLYLKNQKLDRPFDEQLFFSEAKRVLKKDGFIVLFGRGTSFYRWNCMLADLGFTFKEEFVWDKRYCTSPLMAVSRVHETISIHSKGKGIIARVKVPYLEIKGHDISAICVDLKRFLSGVKNEKSLKAVCDFIENNCRDISDSSSANNLSISSDITKENRSVSVMRSIKQGFNEKTIIRNDRYYTEKFTKHGINADVRQSGDRCVNTVQSISFGLNEKSIIKQTREHYSSIHPTQKPPRLLERLLALVSKEGDVILDPFSGSGSTAIACINSNRNYIGFEIDREYYDASLKRIKKQTKQLKLEI